MTTYIKNLKELANDLYGKYPNPNLQYIGKIINITKNQIETLIYIDWSKINNE